MFTTELNISDGTKDSAPWKGLTFWDSVLLVPRSEVHPLPFFPSFFKQGNFQVFVFVYAYML